MDQQTVPVARSKKQKQDRLVQHQQLRVLGKYLRQENPLDFPPGQGG